MGPMAGSSGSSKYRNISSKPVFRCQAIQGHGGGVCEHCQDQGDFRVLFHGAAFNPAIRQSTQKYPPTLGNRVQCGIKSPACVTAVLRKHSKAAYQSLEGAQIGREVTASRIACHTPRITEPYFSDTGP